MTPDLHALSLRSAPGAARVAASVSRWLCRVLLLSAVAAHGQSLEVIRIGSNPAVPGYRSLFAPGTVDFQISPSLNPSRVGEPVTFNVTTTSAGGVLASTVTLLDGNVALSAPEPLAQGAVAVTASFFGAGSFQIPARYTGEGNFSSTTSAPITQTVTHTPYNNTKPGGTRCIAIRALLYFCL